MWSGYTHSGLRPIAIQELDSGCKFVGAVVLAAVCTVSEVAQRAFGAFLIKLHGFFLLP
jgi:hypothetical protein